MPATKFVNRHIEIQEARNLLGVASGARIRVWDADAASGLSVFLRHLRAVTHNQGYTFYVDCANSAANSVFSQIVLAIYEHYRPTWGHFCRWVKNESGERGTRLVKAALTGLPWLGPGLREGIEEFAPSFDPTRYPSATADLICRYLMYLRTKRPVLVLLDNAQALDDWSLELFETTTGESYAGINYILTMVEREEASNAFSARERIAGVTLDFDTWQFPSPSPRLVREIYAQFEVDISEEDAVLVVEAAQSNIYTILRALRRRLRRGNDYTSLQEQPLSPVAREVLAFLGVAQQGLRLSDLLALVAGCPWIAFDVCSSKGLEEHLEALQETSIVQCSMLPDGDQLFTLAQSSVREGEHTPASDQIVIANHLFKYYQTARYQSSRHSQAEVLPLLYRLAKMVDPTVVPGLTQDLVSLSQQMGSLGGARRFMNLATLPRTPDLKTFSDFAAQVSFLLSTRLYSEALQRIEEVESPSWKATRLFSILKAIALNRCRRHEASIISLKKLIGSATSSEERVLLASYLIAGFLHSNKVTEARGVFMRWRADLKDAENYGYYLRNGASSYPSAQAVPILDEAEVTLRGQGDDFGFATAACNKATFILDLGRPKDALASASEAHSRLEIFGIHHLHIAKNNLGLAHLLLRDYRKAAQLLEAALVLARTAMPRLFVKLNLAACYCMMGREAEAVQLLDTMSSEVDIFPVDRVRQKFYLNAALVHWWGGSPRTTTTDFIRRASHHPDRMDPSFTSDRLAVLRSLLERQDRKDDDFFRIFYPAYLQYWYQNPLEGLPAQVLTTKAKGQDTHE